jgi:cell division protein FtsA
MMAFLSITHDIRLGLGVLKSQAEAMKVQFGSALATEANANAFVTIPGLKGMPAKEISVKSLAGIIQARMSEILDFVTYHLKQVGLDSRLLNGGIILTGGGSQLKHLIQLTEYTTGLNARIGLPNEHLAPNHIDELKKPMYSTCLGLILKGYNDYERNNKTFPENFKKVEVPTSLKLDKNAVEEVIAKVVTTPETDAAGKLTVDPDKMKKRLGFWDRFKDNLIDIFAEDEDKTFQQ